MSYVDWDISLATRGGTAVNSTSYDGSVTNQYLKHATDLQWSIPLNGIDQLDFSLYLDDPAAALIAKKQSVIRIWRHINDPIFSKTRTPPSGTPDFCGIVTSITKSGASGKMAVTAMAPLWLLQVHYHLLNHRLVTDTSVYGGSHYEGGNADDAPWDHSALMFRLIDMINGAFKLSGGDTGIRKPPTADYGPDYWPRTITVSPFFVERFSNVWANVFENLMARAASPDIHPEYIWNSGSKDVMYFKTEVVRGTDVSGDVSLDYRTGLKNLDDLTESSQVIPGTYGNRIVVVGDGGPNGPNVLEAFDSGDISANGLFMARTDIESARLRDMADLTTQNLHTALASDDPIYTANVSPVGGLYYDIDYSVGDLVNLNADKGALSATDVKQRVYMVTLGYSDNKVETTDIQISADFKRKYP
jgi:hypothetical protein